MGRGPMTGRGLGVCAGDQPPAWGGFAGRGRGGGRRGWRHVYNATGLSRWARPGPAGTMPAAPGEVAELRARALLLEAELADIVGRLQALEGAGAPPERVEPA